MHLDPKQCDSLKEEPYMSLSSATRRDDDDYEEVSDYTSLTPSTMTRETVRLARLPQNIKVLALRNNKKEGPYSVCNPASKDKDSSTS